MISESEKTRLKEILRIDSVQAPAENGKPFGPGAHDCLIYALDMMKKSGLTVKNVDGYCGWGEVGSGDLFGILCHLDVVPVGKGWHYPPFGATEEDGRIYARGALDDKGPFMAAFFALERLLSEGLSPKKRIRFILGCNEESGWACMDRYKTTEEMPSLGFSPDADFPVINCEKGIVYHSITYPLPEGLISIQAGERANMVPDEATAVLSDGTVLTEKGVSAHGSTPQKGDNALLKLLKKLVNKFDFAKEAYDAFSDPTGKNIGLDLTDEISGDLTHNLGTARTENGKVVFELDVRHPVTYRKEQITAILTEKLTGAVKETFFHLPLYVPEDHPLVRALLKAYNEVTGQNAKPIVIGGGTYARVLPCGVAFGPCFPESSAGIHCPDEYLDVSDFEKTIDIYYRAIKSLCF